MQHDACVALASEQPGVVRPRALIARGISLRPERDDDLPWLRDLYADTRSDELAHVPWPETAKRAFVDQQFTLQRTHYRQHYPDADFLIVQTPDERIGRLYLQRATLRHVLVDISLLPGWRGKGVGTTLIVHAQTLAQAAGCGVALHVLHANPAARRLYARLGFLAGDASSSHLAMHWQPAEMAATPLS